jgi:5-methylcytosine-specific restriction endonuclease McrA
MATATTAKPKQKANIPKALREQVWVKYMGHRYEGKCRVTWCTNKISVFQFDVGHNVPESKGGSTTLDNLRPICSRCNTSMNNKYTIDEWNRLGTATATATATAPATGTTAVAETGCCGFWGAG